MHARLSPSQSLPHTQPATHTHTPQELLSLQPYTHAHNPKQLKTSTGRVFPGARAARFVIDFWLKLPACFPIVFEKRL